MTVGNTPMPDQEVFLSHCPWRLEPCESHSAVGSRLFLLSAGAVYSAASREMGSSSNLRVIVDKNGRSWHRLEFSHNQGTTEIEAEIEVIREGGRSILRIKEACELPTRELLEEVAEFKSHGEDDIADDMLAAHGFDSKALNGIGILNLIDRHADLMYRLCQRTRPLGPYNEYEFAGNHLRSAYRLCKSWERIGKSRTPPLSLIVRLAAELPETIEQVCGAPRVVLRRLRELEAAARIREVDPACIRWLGRQPGRTLIEKAGAKQQLLAVVRREDCDTLENRVVRDLMVRCRHLGRSYLARNKGFSGNERLKTVERFVAICEKHLRHSPIGAARPISGGVQPNYVLQHELRYQVLWNAYLRLLRDEQVTQSVWQWRDHVWLEWLTLGLLSSLQKMSLRSPGSRLNVSISTEPAAGRFVDDSVFGPWWSRSANSRELYLVRGHGVDSSPMPDEIKQLTPDLAIMTPRSESPCLCIWSILDVLEPVATARRMAEELSLSVSSVDKGAGKYLIVVGGAKKLEQGAHGDKVHWLAVPLMFQDSLKSWMECIVELIEHV
jgi:hypothetical protein